MFIKRVFDIIVSLMGLLFLVPVLLVIALLIKLRMPGAVFFSQYRVGRNSQLFKMIKFRSMQAVHNGSSITVKGEPMHKDTGAPAPQTGPSSASTPETAGPKASTAAPAASPPATPPAVPKPSPAAPPAAAQPPSKA